MIYDIEGLSIEQIYTRELSQRQPNSRAGNPWYRLMQWYYLQLNRQVPPDYHPHQN